MFWLMALNIELPYGVPNETQPVTVAVIEGQEFVLMNVETARRYAIAFEEASAYKKLYEVEKGYNAELERRLRSAEIRAWVMPVAVALGFLTGAYISLQR